MEDQLRENEEKKTVLSDLAHTAKYDSTNDDFTLNESGGIIGVDKFEDVLEIIGTSGRWNFTIFFLCSLGPFANAFQSLTYEFLGATPDYWCHVAPLVDDNWTKQQIFDLAIPSIDNSSDWDRCKMYNYNYSLAVEIGYDHVMAELDVITIGNDSTPVNCRSRDFDTSVYKSTVVIDWDLVCERRALYSTTQAATQIGTLLGSLASGYFLDKLGRRPVILVCVVLWLVAGIGSVVSPVLNFYIIMKTLTSFFICGVYAGTFVLVMELCSPAQRSSIGSMFVMPWAIGYIMVPGIAYIIRPWRWLQAAYTLPVLLLLSYFWLLPESPRWLISRGRSEKAVEILSSAAKINRRPVPPSEALIMSLKTMMPKKKEMQKGSITKRIISNIKYVLVPVTRSDLRVKTFISCFCWFSVSMVYFGVSLNSENLSVDPYMYMFLGGVVEVVSYLLLWLMLTCMSRKASLISLYVFGTITISIIAILLAAIDGVSSGIIMFLSLSGKLAITAAFQLIYIFTAELFPTQYRSLAVGEASFMGRIGSILSPYINDLLGAAISWGPSAVFASVSIVAAGLSLILPETKGIDLLEDNYQEKEENQDIGTKPNQGIPNEAFEAENI